MRNEARHNSERGLTRAISAFMALGSAIGTGLFYGSAASHPMAGPAVLAGLPDRRRGGLYGHARAGRNGRASAGVRLVRPLRQHYLGPDGRFHPRLDLRLRNDHRVPGGRHRLRHLHGVLVPGRCRWVWVLGIVC
jgi:histidine transporter